MSMGLLKAVLGTYPKVLRAFVEGVGPVPRHTFFFFGRDIFYEKKSMTLEKSCFSKVAKRVTFLFASSLRASFHVFPCMYIAVVH